MRDIRRFFRYFDSEMADDHKKQLQSQIRNTTNTLRGKVGALNIIREESPNFKL